jgi:hypothetical protein
MVDHPTEKRILLPVLLIIVLLGLLLSFFRIADWMPEMGYFSSFLLGFPLGLAYYREIIPVIRNFGTYCRREGWVKGLIAIVSLFGLFLLVPVYVISVGLALVIRLLINGRPTNKRKK